MAKSRRKSNGCKRGTYKRKNLGKGWLADRKAPGRPKPVVREDKGTSSSGDAAS